MQLTCTRYVHISMHNGAWNLRSRVCNAVEAALTEVRGIGSPIAFFADALGLGFIRRQLQALELEPAQNCRLLEPDWSSFYLEKGTKLTSWEVAARQGGERKSGQTVWLISFSAAEVGVFWWLLVWELHRASTAPRPRILGPVRPQKFSPGNTEQNKFV